MECDYAHLNYNLLVSLKKVVKGLIIKKVYCNYLVIAMTIVQWS
jgi:hypothetical protein